MPSSQTPNYNLNQWSKDDRVLMEDFNADNAKIDAAIGGLRDFVGEPLRFASGSYRGTGTQTNTVHMGLRPKFVRIVRMDGYEQRLIYFGAAHEFTDQQNLIGRQLPSGVYTCTPTADGLTVSCTSDYLGETRSTGAACNLENTTYAWFAFGT